MNRYAAIALAHAARCGRRVLVVTGSHRATEDALDEFARFTDDADVTRTNGSQRITWPTGGTIRFAPLGSNRERGLSVDTVYLEPEVPDTREVTLRFMPCILTSPTGELVRA